jgi:hypothetical protein
MKFFCIREASKSIYETFQVQAGFTQVLCMLSISRIVKLNVAIAVRNKYLYRRPAQRSHLPELQFSAANSGKRVFNFVSAANEVRPYSIFPSNAIIIQ